jgi:hypothetical protein
LHASAAPLRGGLTQALKQQEQRALGFLKSYTTVGVGLKLTHLEHQFAFQGDPHKTKTTCDFMSVSTSNAGSIPHGSKHGMQRCGTDAMLRM